MSESKDSRTKSDSDSKPQTAVQFAHAFDTQYERLNFLAIRFLEKEFEENFEVKNSISKRITFGSHEFQDICQTIQTQIEAKTSVNNFQTKDCHEEIDESKLLELSISQNLHKKEVKRLTEMQSNCARAEETVSLQERKTGCFPLMVGAVEQLGGVSTTSALKMTHEKHSPNCHKSTMTEHALSKQHTTLNPLLQMSDILRDQGKSMVELIRKQRGDNSVSEESLRLMLEKLMQPKQTNDDSFKVEKLKHKVKELKQVIRKMTAENHQLKMISLVSEEEQRLRQSTSIMERTKTSKQNVCENCKFNDQSILETTLRNQTLTNQLTLCYQNMHKLETEICMLQEDFFTLFKRLDMWGSSINRVYVPKLDRFTRNVATVKPISATYNKQDFLREIGNNETIEIEDFEKRKGQNDSMAENAKDFRINMMIGDSLDQNFLQRNQFSETLEKKLPQVNSFQQKTFEKTELEFNSQKALRLGLNADKDEHVYVSEVKDKNASQNTNQETHERHNYFKSDVNNSENEEGSFVEFNSDKESIEQNHDDGNRKEQNIVVKDHNSAMKDGGQSEKKVDLRIVNMAKVLLSQSEQIEESMMHQMIKADSLERNKLDTF